MGKDKNGIEDNGGRKKSIFVRISQWVLIILTSLVVLMLVLSFMLRIPSVQDWGTKQITSRFSRALGVEVGAESFRFRLIDNFDLNGFYLLDHEKDTLIRTKTLAIDVQSGWRGLFQRRISINELLLDGADIKLITKEGAEMSSLASIFIQDQEKSSSPKTKKKKTILITTFKR